MKLKQDDSLNGVLIRLKWAASFSVIKCLMSKKRVAVDISLLCISVEFPSKNVTTETQVLLSHDSNTALELIRLVSLNWRVVDDAYRGIEPQRKQA